MTKAIEKELEGLSLTQLAEVYNLNNPATPVKRFGDRPSAVRRTVAQIIANRKEAPTEPKAKKSTNDVSRDRGIFRRPHEELVAAREGTKTAAIIDLLARKNGATLSELANVLSQKGKTWTPKRAKEWLSWTVNSVKGYGIDTAKEGSEFRYKLVLPKGYSAPVPHRPRSV